ncbi:hypothetical protein [Pseudofrankia sp. BMG5.36]|uniref:hypothetical protein n=1 Tax=Pseudofrankia sp. BMG5.36 TaxID=1834512 RepID=UPI0008DA470B|nr:hypothetical protein [Pseudofrankia sp. BMG5.36]OHV69573.1 hypothetical protein BCD48_34785 [Pseudofrankia sp. BMG5.36]
MLSRACRDLAAYLLRRDEIDQADDDETWLSATPGPGPDDPLDQLDQLAARLDRSRAEHFADADADADADYAEATSATLPGQLAL